MFEKKYVFHFAKSTLSICLLAFLPKLNGQIITQPKNLSVCYKVTGLTFVKTISSKDKFQWEYKDVTWKKLSNDSNWSGTNNDTLIFLNQKGILINYSIRCIVDSAGANIKSFISNEILIKSFGQLVSPGIQKQQNICYNGVPDTLKINKNASGGDSIIKYQWQVKTYKSANYSNIGKVNDNSISLGNLKNSKTIRLFFETKSCGFGYSDTLNVLVYDSIVKPKIGAHQVICHNATPSQLLTQQTAKGGGDTFLYSWFYKTIDQLNYTKIDSSGKLKLQLGQQTKTSYVKLRAISQKGCGTFYSDSIGIIVLKSLGKPKISSSQRICFGSIPKLIKIDSLAKGGNDTFNYLWQNRNINGSWQDIAGASQITFQPPTLSLSKYYRVKATSTRNCGSVFSDSVFISALSKISKPKISKNQTICYNTQPQTLDMDSSAFGGNDTFTYNWQILGSGATWQNIAGANLKSFTPGSLIANTSYRILATSTAGCGVFPSDSIKIIVYPKIVRPRINSNQTICFGFTPNKLQLNNPASGGSGQFNYQWQSSPNKTTWTNIGAANGLETTPGSLTVTSYYRVKINDLSCGQFFSDTATITVLPKLTKGILEASAPVCFGGALAKPINFIATGKPRGGNDSFNNNVERSYNVANWASIGVLNPSGYLENNLKKSSYYRVTSVSKLGCGSIVTDSIYVTVYDSFTAPIIGNQQVVCEGEKLKDTLKILLPHSRAGSSFSYNWQKLNTGNIWTDIPGFTKTSFNSKMFNTTDFRLKVRSLNNCGEVFSNSIKIEVNKGPDTLPISGNTVICKQSTDQLFQTKMLSGVSYNWSIKNATITRGQSTHQILLDWNNTGIKEDTVFLTRTNLNTGCANILSKGIEFTNQTAPKKSAVMNINGTTILVSSDSTKGLSYTWGYINKLTRNEVNERTTAVRYYSYNNSIDTSKNIYFVKTSSGNCFTVNYYKADVWTVNANKIAKDHFKIYPNPSYNGVFNLSIPLGLNVKPVIYDMNGRVLQNVINDNRVLLEDYPPSTYILKDDSGMLKSVYLIKIK